MKKNVLATIIIFAVVISLLGTTIYFGHNIYYNNNVEDVSDSGVVIKLLTGQYIKCDIENIQVEWDRQILIVIKNGKSEIYPLHNIIYIKVPKGYYLY
jgi:hypothetical protein